MEITIEITQTPYEQLGTAYKRLGEIMAELTPKQTRYDEIKELAKEAKGLKVDIKPLAKEAKKVKKDIKKLSKMVQEPRKPRKAKDTDAGTKPTPEPTPEPSGAQTSESPRDPFLEGIMSRPSAPNIFDEAPIETTNQNEKGVTAWPLRESPQEPPTEPPEPITAPRKRRKGHKSSLPSKEELAKGARCQIKGCGKLLKSDDPNDLCQCGK